MAGGFCVVLVSAPAGKPSRKIADTLLDARLAACVQILPGVESRYWWEGKQRVGRESLLLIKTRRSHVKRIEKAVTAVHPYCTPEILSVPVLSGNAPYLAWLSAETTSRRAKE